MKKVIKISALALSLVSMGAFCQSVSLLNKTDGMLEVTITDGTSCQITPNVTSQNITNFGQWVNFGSMTFGCKNADGEATFSTLGFPADSTVVKPDTRKGYTNRQVWLVANSDGEQLDENKYFFRTMAIDNVTYGSPTDDETGIFLTDAPVAVTNTAGEGSVSLEGYIPVGSSAQHFNIPLMVKAWN